ncbi:MAG TPA: polysaccharide deacetylase family protein [Acidimicrobiales bacterium]
MAVWRGRTDKALVALTFDAGSDCGNAANIITMLEANGVPATFGLTGKWVELCGTAAAQIGQAGYPVLNHSYSHPSFTGYSTQKSPLTRAQILDELAKGEAAIKKATGRAAKPWFRPPYGDQNAFVLQVVGEAGYRWSVMWTIDSRGWQGVPPEQVISNVVDKAVNGAIVVMHVGSASTDYAALQAVIDGLRARGFGFATVSGIV